MRTNLPAQLFVFGVYLMPALTGLVMAGSGKVEPIIWVPLMLVGMAAMTFAAIQSLRQIRQTPPPTIDDQGSNKCVGWACPICGQEYENLHDVRWICPCRTDPNIVRAAASHFLRSLALGVMLGLGIGAALGLIMFSLAGIPLWLGIAPGATIGVLVGFIWGFAMATFPIHQPGITHRSKREPHRNDKPRCEGIKKADE